MKTTKLSDVVVKLPERPEIGRGPPETSERIVLPVLTSVVAN
jgi:hypothetical protein